MLPRIKPMRLRLVKEPFDSNDYIFELQTARRILVDNSTAKKDKPDREFAVGDKLKVKLHDGRIVDATVRAIVDDGEKLQVDFGHEETALVKPGQVVD